MSFLNPHLLWFASAASIPVIIHLLHRRKYKRVQWAAMLFLKNAIRRSRNRIRLENLLLMLIRMLILIALAFAISKPYMEHSLLAGAFDTPTAYYFVIDNSISMRYKHATQTIFDKAKALAADLLKGLDTKPDDRFTVVTFNKYPRSYPDFVTKEGAEDLIKNISLSQTDGNAYSTFFELGRLLAKSPHMMRRIYVITDLQAANWKAPNVDEKALSALLKKISHDDNNFISIIDVGEDGLDNCAVVAVTPADAYAVSGAKTVVTATLYNYSDTDQVREVTLSAEGNKISSRKVTLKPNEPADVSFDFSFGKGGYTYVTCSMDKDGLSIDDSRSLALKVYDSVKVLVIDGEPAGGWNSESAFLRSTLAPSDEVIQYYTVDVVSPPEFAEQRLSSYDIVCVLNVSYLPTKKIQALEEYVKYGGSLFVSMGGLCSKEFYNSPWMQKLVPVTLEQAIDCDSSEGAISFVDKDSMPMLSERIIELSRVKYRRFIKVTGNYSARELMKITFMDEEFPLLLLSDIGLGKVIVYASSLDDEWSRFCYSPLYPLFLFSSIELLLQKAYTDLNYQIGDIAKFVIPKTLFEDKYLVKSSASSYNIYPKLEDPEALFIQLFFPQEQVKHDREANMNYGIDHASVYTVFKKDMATPILHFAANIPPRRATVEEIAASESNLERLRDLKLLYPDFKYTYGSNSAFTAGNVKTVGFWRHLLRLALILLIIETLFAFYVDMKRSV